VSFDLDDRAVPRRMTVAVIKVDNSDVEFQPRLADLADAQRLLRRILPRHLDWQEVPGVGTSALLSAAGPDAPASPVRSHWSSPATLD
jgi:hypothetical protein